MGTMRDQREWMVEPSHSVLGRLNALEEKVAKLEEKYLTLVGKTLGSAPEPDYSRCSDGFYEDVES